MPPPPGSERLPGLVASAWARDGTVEAIEDPGSRFRIGVQWHPETADDQGLFAGLVAAASGHPLYSRLLCCAGPHPDSESGRKLQLFGSQSCSLRPVSE